MKITLRDALRVSSRCAAGSASSVLALSAALTLALAILGCQTQTGSATGEPMASGRNQPGVGTSDSAERGGTATPSSASSSSSSAPSSTLTSPGSSMSGADTASAPRTEISTRHALFQPIAFQQLPNWPQQRFEEAFSTFKRGCVVLGKKPNWMSSCSEAQKVLVTDPLAIKGYFEREFTPYLVMQRDRSPLGNLTGYFEPLLKGSRERRAPFLYPVYETPSDLLLLDGKEVDAATAQGDQARFLITGRDVKLIESKPGTVAVGPRVYKLSLNDQQPGTRDRRFRVRVEGNQIVSYPSRQEIEKGGRILAKPIAWVESKEALYAMHVQGSGRILLPNQTVLRVSYAEQNGHSFLPRSDTNELALAPKTRSFEIQTTTSQAASRNRKGISNGTIRATSLDAVLISQRAPSTSAAQVGLEQETIGSGFYGSRFDTIRDPSYVFFRELHESPDGPIGAMGVPLTAGRSIAVDPRVTPLGAPVMIENRKLSRASGGASDPGPAARLMVAQDTGGAIRGAVRADYFWGFGKSAGTQALRTNDELKMWVLLPKAFRPQILASSGGQKTRGLGTSQEAECLIPDADLCADN
jgi:membrane-bound lytic murein transglycosylase A